LERDVKWGYSGFRNIGAMERSCLTESEKIGRMGSYAPMMNIRVKMETIFKEVNFTRENGHRALAEKARVIYSQRLKQTLEACCHGLSVPAVNLIL
jgi:hypothetical protein